MRQLDQLTREITNDQATSFYNAFQSNLEDVEITRKGNDISIQTTNSQGSKVVDLKQSFKNSAKAKKKDKGGWYMVVPIRRYASRGRKDQARGMSKRLYNTLNRAQNNTNVVTDYLYDNRKSHSPIPELNYTPKSNSITKKNNPRGRGSMYISFRTVSDKSAPNSWLLNRHLADENSLTKEIEDIINQVRRFNQ